MALLKDLAPPVRPKATLVYSPHPLLVDAGRVVQQTVAIRGESVGDYLRRHGIDTDKPLVVSVDGKPVARDEWELLDAEEGMLVAARGALAGGDGGGSQVVAMVAMIALAVFAPYLAGAAYGMMTSGTALTMAQASVWAANSVIGMVMTGAVTMAGSMLINKLMPAPKMDLGKGLGALQASSNYSITGGQNRARPFEPLALVLGTHRVFFDLAGRPYSTYQGEDQYLYQVFCVGLVGPHGAYDVSDLRIGTTLLSTYEGVTTETSIGTMPTMMPANVDTIAGASITAADPQTVRTTSPNTTKIELDFTCMSYRARSDGDIDPALLDWTIEYCPAGTGTWQVLEYVSTNGNGQKPIRLSRSYAVDSGTYDVRVTGHTLGTSSKFIRQLTWDAVKCYQPDDGYYEGQQFLAVKIKATGQLNGVIDRLNGIVKMPTAPGVYSSNPADLLSLFAIGHKAADGRPLWGGQLSPSALDVAGLDAWRTWCTAKGLTFNAVVDSQRSVWDILQSITRCGRGSPTWAPGKLGVVWDADNQPVVASFNMANITRGSFEVAYQSEAPVDEVVLTYVNAADDYAADTVRALAPGVTSPAKSATIELWGCTNQAMAVKECHLALAENLYRTRLVSWETDMEGLVVTRGDVVSLSHDLTQWGKSGRLVAGTTTALELDQAITLDSAGTWIGIIAPDGTQYTCRVAYQAGDHSAITLLDPLPIAPDADNPIDWRYTADYVATPGKLVKIVSIVPAGMDSVKLTAVDEYDEYYAAEHGTYTPPTKREWASNQPQIRSLGVTEEIVKSGGSHTTKLIISWSEAGNVASRLVRYSIDGGPLEIAGHANGSRFELIVPDAGTVMIVVTLYDGLGQTSSGAQASVTHTLQGLAYAPFELASFTGVGGLFQTRLSWVFQGDINDVKFVEVWGGNLNNRANATLLTTQAVPANGWLHTGLQTGQTWFYWARVVDSKNRPSDYLPLSATAGLSVTTSSDPSDLLDALTGSITEDALYVALNSRIDLIDAPTTGAHAKIAALDSRVTTLQSDVAQLSGTPEYDPAVTYQLDDMVKYLGGLYRAIGTTTGNAPTNATYWQKIGDYASLGDAVAAHAVILDDHETRVTAAEGAITSEATERSTLATQLRGTYTGTDVALLTSGLIFNERQARSTADASEVTARQALATKMTGAADPSSLTLATLSSGLLYDERQARSTADATEVTARQALSAKLTGFSDPNGKVLADLTSGLIFEEKSARVTAVSAVASDVSTLSTTVAGHTASIQTQATSINGIEAKYSVKIDNNGYITGIGLISTANNGTPTSSFIVLVDKFAVVTPGQVAKTPFVVGTVNGQSTVGIDGTLVVDGSIVANKIDTRGLTVKDAAGNVILSSGVPLDWALVGGANRPADNATKNTIFVQDSLPSSPGTGDLWQNSLAEVPSLDLRFDLGYVDPRITFTRSSTATYFGSDGLLKMVAANEPRIDYDPVTKECRGLLIEEARTNLLTYSQDFGNTAGWANSSNSSVIQQNVDIAPDGTLTADYITTPSASTQGVFQIVTVTASTAYTLSFWAKRSAETEAWLRVYDNTGGTNVVSRNYYGDINATGYTRVTQTFTTPVGCTSIRVYVQADLGSAAKKGAYLWGAQLEAGAFPTSYIPTTTAAVTRAADVATMTGANFSSWFNATEGAFVTDSRQTALNAATPSYVFCADNGTANEMIAAYHTASAERRFVVTDNGVDQANSSLSAAQAGISSKIAFSYKANDFAGVANAGAVQTDSAGALATVDRLAVGNRSDGTRPWNGHIRRLTYYPKRLTNAQLPAQTVGVAPKSVAKWSGTSWTVISDIDKALGSAIVAKSAADVVAANFNASNDRNAAAITAPTIATTGTAVDHTIQTDGSADISVEWSWAGTEGDIDGFLVYVRQSSSSSAYTFGTTPAEETVYTVPAAKRAFILFGTAANQYYTFGVQAYRSVDKDINAAGVIKSTLVKATGAGENPYRPSATVAFAGNVTGTIDGIATADLNKWDKISGAGKPADGATVGATWGSNIGGQPTDEALLNARLVARPNLVRGLKSWTMGGSNWVNTASPYAEDHSTLVIPNGSNGVASSSPTMNLAQGFGQITVSFRAFCSSAGRVLNVDLFPDTLPQSSVALTTTPTDYSFVWAGTHADLASCVLRFFAGAEAGQIEIGNVKIEAGGERSVWVPHKADGVGINNPVTPSNASTYIADAWIGQAIVDGALKSSAYVAGSSGWKIGKDGSAEFRNVTVRGDVEASSLKADSANIVQTLHLQGNAVTVPQHAQFVDAINSAVWCPGNTETRIISVSDYIDTGGNPVVVMFSGQLTYTFEEGSINYVGVALIVNGVVHEWRAYSAGTALAQYGAVSFSSKVSLSTGSNLIQIGLVIYPWSGGKTVQHVATPRRTLTLLGCKR